METIKKKRAKSYIWLSIIVGVLIIACGIYFVYYHGKTYDSSATAYVDGRIETEEDAVNKVIETVYENSPANIIEDKESEDVKIAYLFVGLMDKSEDNNLILNMIKESDIKATFAISASEGLENKEFVNQLKNENIELISNGLKGEDNLQNKDIKDIVKTLYKSHETLSTSANVTLNYLYCSGTKINNNVLLAASASGYDTLVIPSEGNVINYDNFESEEEVTTYLSSISGEIIVVINLREEKDEIEDEDMVVAEKPAIDKQPDLDDSSIEEEDEESKILDEVKWVLDTTVNQEIETIYVKDIKTTDGVTYLRSDLINSTNLSTVYEYCLTDKKQVGLAINNLPSSEELNDLITLLSKHKKHITFFVTKNDIDSRSDDINTIIENGHSIGVTTDKGTLNNLDREGIFDNLYDCLKAGKSLDLSNIFLLQDEVSAELRVATAALNLYVVKPQNPESPFAGALYIYDSLDEETLSNLESLTKQSSLSITDYKTVLDNSGTISTLSTSEVNALRKQNNGEKLEAQNIVYTTQRAASLVFYDLSNEVVVKDVINKLHDNNAKGTFFVTLNELMTKQEVIEDILDNGNEIGIWYNVTSDYPQIFESVVNYIHTWQEYSKWRYGADSNAVFMLSNSTSETQEAVSASGCELVKNTYLIVKSEDENITLEETDQALERIENLRVMRGSLICFNMNFYTNDVSDDIEETILGNVLNKFIEQHIDSLAFVSYKTREIEDASRFELTTVSNLLSSDERYSFVEDTQSDITLDKNVLTNLSSDEERFDYIDEHYYGANFINSSISLPGFTDKEIAQLDTTGTFTNDKVLFLTFDDWGTEESLNKLLYVLDKYNVKATFFIRTEYVDSNPNLLRAIAEKGHQIACHTDTHFALSNTVGNSSYATSLTEQEAKELREDIVTSYNKLYKYTGDVVVDGKKSLTRMFRPPTLAVSKIGISQVFDVGFSYSISGEISTGDYAATSYNDMVNRLNYGSDGWGGYIYTHNGTVLVMHMQESAKYTAQALDTMIPIWISQGYSFARIDDYLSE